MGSGGLSLQNSTGHGTILQGFKYKTKMQDADKKRILLCS